jgi:hypothetical protein
MTKARLCAFCGERVLAVNGFFRSYPDSIALHHKCVRAYLAARA